MILPDFLTQDDDGEIRLTGHRIGLYTIVRCVQEGYSAERICEEFPSLKLALVEKVLSFAEENKAEVSAYASTYRAELERQEAAHVPSQAELEVRRFLENQQNAEAAHRAERQ
jgi:uncharacterized protein (DUF433 family)